VSSESSLRHTIHSSTWTLVQRALKMTQSAVWPRLQIFLLDLKNSWDSYPSKPSLEFFDSLSVVCQVLRWWHVSSVVCLRYSLLTLSTGSTVGHATTYRSLTSRNLLMRAPRYSIWHVTKHFPRYRRPRHGRLQEPFHCHIGCQTLTLWMQTSSY